MVYTNKYTDVYQLLIRKCQMERQECINMVHMRRYDRSENGYKYRERPMLQNLMYITHMGQSMSIS